MEKIPTIFDRNWEGDRKVVNRPLVDISDAFATEKLDGTNVRLTVRNGLLVRLEARRNPDRAQKDAGIVDPWYRDAPDNSSGDRYIWEAAENTDLTDVPDGEWPGEAIGPKIQGNALGLVEHTVVLFSVGRAPFLASAPHCFDRLSEWLPDQRSALNPERAIEGVVWWRDGVAVGKIKVKDFPTEKVGS